MNAEKTDFNYCIYTQVSDPFCATILNLWWKVCQRCSKEKVIMDVFGHYIKQPSPWCYVRRTLLQPIKSFIYQWHFLHATSHAHLAFIVYETNWSEKLYLRSWWQKCKYSIAHSCSSDTTGNQFKHRMHNYKQIIWATSWDYGTFRSP